MYLSKPRIIALSFSFSTGAALCAYGSSKPDRIGPLSEEFTPEVVNLNATPEGVIPLPDFKKTPHIRDAVASLPSRPSVKAVVSTRSGQQIYKCSAAASGGYQWSLLSPLATLVPATFSDSNLASRNAGVLKGLVTAAHFRSDYESRLPKDILQELGLVMPNGVLENAPVWDFSFTGEKGSKMLSREILAAKVLAQDTVAAESIPYFLLEVRGTWKESHLNGNIISHEVSHIAGATHMLRWNTLGGLAPQANECNETSDGALKNVPYSADYYFLEASRGL